MQIRPIKVNARSHVISRARKSLGPRTKRLIRRSGDASPRAVEVTVTVAVPLAAEKVAGLIAQDVKLAGREHVRFT
jgi:hypothetical protein